MFKIQVPATSGSNLLELKIDKNTGILLKNWVFELFRLKRVVLDSQKRPARILGQGVFYDSMMDRDHEGCLFSEDTVSAESGSSAIFSRIRQ